MASVAEAGNRIPVRSKWEYDDPSIPAGEMADVEVRDARDCRLLGTIRAWIGNMREGQTIHCKVRCPARWVKAGEFATVTRRRRSPRAAPPAIYTRGGGMATEGRVTDGWSPVGMTPHYKRDLITRARDTGERPDIRLNCALEAIGIFERAYLEAVRPQE